MLCHHFHYELLALISSYTYTITPTTTVLSANFPNIEAVSATNKSNVEGELSGNVSQDGGLVMHNATTRTFVLADYRIPVHLFSESPEVPWIQPQDIDDLKRLFAKHKTTLFTTLVGGSAGGQRVRLYTPELIKFPEVYKLVAKCMAPYLRFVRNQYPALQHYKLAALKSMPGAASQYSRCNLRLHSDYAESVNLRTPNERPVSLMVALDPFEFIYLNSRTDRRSDIITQTVHKGQAIAFTNYCLHAGGENNTPQVCYRLFAYIAKNPNDIPNGGVYHYKWEGGDNTEDDVIRIDESAAEVKETPAKKQKTKRKGNSVNKVKKTVPSDTMMTEKTEEKLCKVS